MKRNIWSVIGFYSLAPIPLFTWSGWALWPISKIPQLQFYFMRHTRSCRDTFLSPLASLLQYIHSYWEFWNKFYMCTPRVDISIWPTECFTVCERHGSPLPNTTWLMLKNLSPSSSTFRSSCSIPTTLTLVGKSLTKSGPWTHSYLFIFMYSH